MSAKRSAKTRVSEYKEVKKKANAIISRLERNKELSKSMKQNIKDIERYDKWWQRIGEDLGFPKYSITIDIGGKKEIITPTKLIKEMRKKIKALQEGRANVKGRKRKTSKRRRKGKRNKVNTRKKRRGKKYKTRGKKKSKKSNKNKTRRRRRN